MTLHGYSAKIEPCGEPFGYGDTCPLMKERNWIGKCNRYSTGDGDMVSAAHLADVRKLERKYDAIHGCLTRCAGKTAQRKAIKRIVADLP